LSFSNFSDLKFSSRYVDALPADKVDENYPRQVEHSAYSFVQPATTASPEFVAYSKDLAEQLGFVDIEQRSIDFAKVFTGNELLNGMKPYAMCYGGHQFGQWAGQLGDGRAINLGELSFANTECGTIKYKTIQLKGAGSTPYSRTADGLAVLRSSVREFLCSEAMYHLGIPTTRALSLCLSGEEVMRDMFYDGRAKLELGAVVCRVSSSFTRFGSFQLPASRGDIPLLKSLVDNCIEFDFPHLLTEVSLTDNIANNQALYLAWFSEVCQSTCQMVVHWMRVGFVHGVMNTDNMSILGETIDFGPYGWLDNFDPNWTPNTSDEQHKRYRFSTQAQIAQWNCFQLANAIFPLINEAEPLENILNNFAKQYQQDWQNMMAQKLGFIELKPESDETLFLELEQLLALVETDMTIFYRQLAKLPLKESSSQNNFWLTIFSSCYYDSTQLDDDYKIRFSIWLKEYIARALVDQQSPAQRQQTMNAINPKYILRNYLAQDAIELAEQGDYSGIHTLQTLLQHPYDEQEDFERYAQKRPEDAKNKAGCSMLSCSS